MNTQTIIESITCPITQEPMREPVSGSDGQTYEKSAIICWLNKTNTSPLDRREMTIDDLRVNTSIRFLCDKFHNGMTWSVKNMNEEPILLGEPVYTNTGSVSTIYNNDIYKSDESNISKIEIGYDIYKSQITNDNHRLISVGIDEKTMPSGMSYISQDIVIVIDRSAYMSEIATTKNKNGKYTKSGWSVQDIVNHAACMIVQTVDNNSRITILAFDKFVDIIMPSTLMCDINKSNAIAKIKDIKPKNTETNLWCGIVKAIDIIAKLDNTERGRNPNILLLSGGAPTISPSVGEVEALKNLSDEIFIPPIYTFGFGTHLQNGLLYEIAKYTCGNNSYIYDADMIATVFCNCIATILTCVAVDLQLSIKTVSGAGLSPGFMSGDYTSRYDGETKYTTFYLGTVHREQSRDFIINVEPNEIYEIMCVSAVAGTLHGGSKTILTNTTFRDAPITQSINVDVHKNRYDFVSGIRKTMSNNGMRQFYESEKLLYEIKNKAMELYSISSDNISRSIIEYITGDESGKDNGVISKAISKQYYTKWGGHFLDQVAISMNVQKKSNSLDFSMPFGGKTFDSIVDIACGIFDTLPPPQYQQTSTLLTVSRKLLPTINMSTFNKNNNMRNIVIKNACVYDN